MNVTDSDVANADGNVALPQQRNSAEEHAAMQYRLQLGRARLDCQTYRSFSLDGNKFFGGGAALGGVLSMLSPNHWSMRRRAFPFFTLGVIGIVADYFDTLAYCTLKFPNKYDTQIDQTIQTQTLPADTTTITTSTTVKTPDSFPPR